MFHSFILLHSKAADKLIKFERIKTKGHRTHTTIIGKKMEINFHFVNTFIRRIQICFHEITKLV